MRPTFHLCYIFPESTRFRQKAAKSACRGRQHSFVDRMLSDKFCNSSKHSFAVGFKIRCDLINAVSHDRHILRRKAPRSARRRADTHAAGDAGFLWVVRDGVFIYGDMHLIKLGLQILARSASIR